jgi:hypothetical protein
VNVQDIVQMVQKQSKPVTPADTRKLLADLRSEAETQITAILVGVMVHCRARDLAAELEVIMSDAEATAETQAARVERLEQAIEGADLSVRKAKADKIMLPSNAPQSETAQADQAIRKAERGLQTAQGNLKTAKNLADQRQRELENLRAIHRTLAGVGMPDVTPIQVLLDAVQ